MLSRHPGRLPFSPARSLPSRARAIGKAALYLLLAFVSAVLVTAMLKAATTQNLQELMQAGPASGLLAHAGLLLAFVVVPTAISLWLWQEPMAAAGWSPVRGRRLAALGLATGAGLMALIVLVLWAVGAYSAAFTPLSPGQAIGVGLLATAVWLIQAAQEEGAARGFAFIQLSRALSFWPAAVSMAAWFGWSHVGQPGATGFSLVMAGLFGLVLAYSLLRTGSLWFAWGFHAAWNFTQSFVFGLANSGGAPPPQALMTASVHGPPLLTGAAAGPEGSLLCLAAAAALVAILHFGVPDDRHRQRTAGTTDD